MANEDEGAVVIIVALAGLAYFWWAGKGGSVGVTGATSTDQAGKGAACGCGDKSLAGAPITTGGGATQAGVVIAPGAVNPGSGLYGRTTRLAGRHTPPPAPGSVGAGVIAGGGAQWQGRQKRVASGLTPGSAPSAPFNPTGSGIWVGHATPRRVQ